VTLDIQTVRHDTLTIAQRCEEELGEEPRGVVDGCQRDGERFPSLDGPILVGIDGGYVRNWDMKKRHFEVIVGKSTLTFTHDAAHEGSPSKCFGFVPTFDTTPTRRLHEVLQSQGFQRHQPITLLSDGGDTVRALQQDLSPDAEDIVDWLHIAMQLTVLEQYAKGVAHQEHELGECLRDQVARLTWSLWHGHLDKALGKIEDIVSLTAPLEEAYSKVKPWRKAMEAFRTSIEHNGSVIPNDGERYRCGKAIATGFVESTVNQVVSKRFGKKQQMQWRKRGAHLLLQTRVKTLNGDLGSVFKRWYPDLQLEEEPQAA
jgi:hypothetical protein